MDTLAFDFDAAQPEQQVATFSNIVPRATVRDMVRRRTAALDAFARAFTALDGASTAQAEAFAALAVIGAKTAENSSYLHLTKEEDRRFVAQLKLPTRADFYEVARKVVDRKMWATLIELTELERIMDKQAKDQLRQDLMDNVPEATEENIFATLQQFAADSGTIFRRGIANCFSKLDRRFRSHDGWKIGSRVILSYAFNEWGDWSYNSNQRDTMHDIDRTFAVLDGRDSPEIYGGIVSVVHRARGGYGKPRQSEHDSDYFKVRCFKNGNAHVWFKRDDLVEKVNVLLGEYYGAPIPEEREAKADPFANPKTALAKNYGFFPTPDRAADEVISGAQLYAPDDKPALTVLEPSAGTGSLASRAVKKGCTVDCIEFQAPLAEALQRSGKYRRVQCADFLSVAPNPVYDRVVMNPPFDRERDIDHVMHALKFLKPDGCLIAVMSAGTEFRETTKSVAFRALMEKMNAAWRDLPAGSFSEVGTNVNTLMVRVWANSHHQRWGW